MCVCIFVVNCLSGKLAYWRAAFACKTKPIVAPSLRFSVQVSQHPDPKAWILKANLCSREHRYMRMRPSAAAWSCWQGPTAKWTTLPYFFLFLSLSLFYAQASLVSRSIFIPRLHTFHQATLLRQTNKRKSFLLPLSSSNNNKNNNWLTSSLPPLLGLLLPLPMSSPSESVI